MTRAMAAIPTADRAPLAYVSRATMRRPMQMRAVWTLDGDTAIASAGITLACIAVMHATGMVHWALVPIGVCGILQAPLLVKWLRGAVDPFDPRSLVALLMFHNTFVAPLLHLSWDWYTSTVVVPPDPWLWFGRMALINALSLLCMEASYRVARSSRARPHVYGLSRRRLAFGLVAATVIALAAQGYVLMLFGGLSGIVTAFEAGGRDLDGTGWLQMLAWPLFVVMLLTWISRQRRRSVGQATILVVLACFAFGHFLWTGLVGSRSSTLAGLLLATAYCHTFVRKLTVRTLLALGMAALLFAFVYGFYKAAGRAGISDALSGDGNLSSLQRQTGRDLPVLLLADLARADIQMEVLQTMYDANTDYRLKLGSTYLSAAVFIPRTIWPTRPYGTQEAYAELTRGGVAVGPGERPGSRVFGMTGETMLNFGWLGVPIAHALFGLLLGFVSRTLYSLKDGDGRLLLVPIATLLIVTIYPSDLVNVVYTFFRDGLVLTACALGCITRPSGPRAVRR